MSTVITIEDGVVISVVVNGVIAWSTVPARLRPGRSYFQINYAAGWGGRFYDYHDASMGNWEGRTIREVLPTDPHYEPDWFPKPTIQVIEV